MKKLLYLTCLCLAACGSNGTKLNKSDSLRLRNDSLASAKAYIMLSPEKKDSLRQDSALLNAQFSKVQMGKTLPGVVITELADEYDSRRGLYKITVMVKKTTKRSYQYLQLNASYQDENGKEVAQSIGGPGFEMKRGDETTMNTDWLFPEKSQIPPRVVLSFSN